MIGFVYLTTIMDLYGRKIISWDISNSLVIDSTLKVADYAITSRQTNTALILHSDRGSQFVSKQYQSLTDNLLTSYSNKANPWDNAHIESFHAIIKRE